ncbi:PP2C family protein-serine/threonine phosphatase [Streptomyces zhihengii]
MSAAAPGPPGPEGDRGDSGTPPSGPPPGELPRQHLTDVATGVLAAQLGLPPVEAAEHLNRLAAAAGSSPEDLAADIVNSVAGYIAVSAPPRTAAHREEARTLRQVAAVVETEDSAARGARTLLDGGLRPLGAQALWLWRLTSTGCLELAGHAGVSALEADQWRWIPPATPPSVRAALSGGESVWLPTGTRDGDTLPGPSPRAARAVIPLRLRGQNTGLALVVWPRETDFDARVRAALPRLVEVAGRLLAADADPAAPVPALDDLLDSLVHPGMTLRRDDATGALTVEHLNRPAAEALSGADRAAGESVEAALPLLHRDLTAMARRAWHVSVPQRAARLPAEHARDVPDTMLDVRVLPAGRERAVVLWHTESDPRTALRRAVARLQGMALFQDDLMSATTAWTEETYAIFGMARDAAPVPLAELGPLVHADDAGAFGELLGDVVDRRKGASAVVRLIRRDGGPRHVRIAAEPLISGPALTGITGVYQDVSAEYHAEVALNATFDQLTAIRAQAVLRHRLVLRLQQAIVPQMPSAGSLHGLSAAARYRPAAAEYRVGGDWFDVLPLPGGRVLVAVGDVAGHGMDAATGMVALRNALRGLAFTGHDPARLMGWLNEVTLHVPGEPTATALCALYDPAGQVLRWANAGHLPPLLLRDGRARLVKAPYDVLLGAARGAAYRERTLGLEPGDTLLLYTDGLVERRTEGLDKGLEALCRTVETLRTTGVDALVEGLLARATGDTDDDTSVVAIRVG